MEKEPIMTKAEHEKFTQEAIINKAKDPTVEAELRLTNLKTLKELGMIGVLVVSMVLGINGINTLWNANTMIAEVKPQIIEFLEEEKTRSAMIKEIYEDYKAGNL